ETGLGVGSEKSKQIGNRTRTGTTRNTRICRRPAHRERCFGFDEETLGGVGSGKCGPGTGSEVREQARVGACQNEGRYTKTGAFRSLDGAVDIRWKKNLYCGCPRICWGSFCSRFEPRLAPI